MNNISSILKMKILPYLPSVAQSPYIIRECFDLDILGVKIHEILSAWLIEMVFEPFKHRKLPKFEENLKMSDLCTDDTT